ncbi:unnamed protein product [Adineta ricciae]|uniref:Uncharacterized protein n=1 Tax=Adineta ricciae TaxID=249248 RepID=A0A814IZ31_ADIRI|nr:unnamed protein product [Adineta ricciae]CAF1385602.1 unnamed protein product [Adineta ricciae]
MGEQSFVQPEKSDYELGITNAFNNLASKMNFTQFVGDDQWTVKHFPKSGRAEPKSRIRKILPGTKDEKPDGKSAPGRQINQKGGFLNRLRTGVNNLVRDENNMLFGEQSKYELNYYEEEADTVDTDDLHRYTQKLRELEDTDREVNPEFLVLRDGKSVYAVHEADEEGKMTLSKRKPIYDRYRDQAPDEERADKKKLLSRLKNPFGRNKDKDGKRSDSLKPINPETPDSAGKRKAKKTGNKTTDDDSANIEAFMD